MDIQKLVDAMSAAGRSQRSQYHVTLGSLISDLETIDGKKPVKFGGADSGYPRDENSYRGYYSDLSFEIRESKITADEFLIRCQKALGKVYEGYKGGDFTMGPETPLWAVQYGCCGNAIIGVMDTPEAFILVTKEIA